MQTWFNRPILTKSASLILLALAALFLTLLLRAPLADALALQAPDRPREVLAANPPCASLSDRTIGFDFLGYLPLDEGATMLAWRITNPKPKALDAVGITAFGWKRVKPTDGGTFQGDLGVYDVKWGDNLDTNGSAGALWARFLPRGTWLREGRQDAFFVTVKQFDPTVSMRVWARINDTVFDGSLVPAGYPCSSIPPTATPTAPPSPLLPTPTPDPSLTLDDYSFSEPRVVMTSPFASLAILDWLPDNRRAIIMPGESFEIQTLDVTTGMTVTYGNIGPTHPNAVWLEDAQKMVFLANRTAGQQLFLSSGSTSNPIQLGSHGFRSALAFAGDRVMALEMGKEAPVLFDSEGNSLPVPPINVLEYGLNDPMAMFGTQLRWHPSEDKVAMFDIGGLLIFDLLTGAVQYFDLNKNGIPLSQSVFGPFIPMDVQWSPDGQKLAFELVRGQPIFGRSWLVILDRNTSVIQNVSLPSLVLSDYAWAPNSRQLLLFGRDRIAQRTWSTTAYLLDTQTRDFHTITPLSTTAKGGYLGSVFGLVTGWAQILVSVSSGRYAGRSLRHLRINPYDWR